MHILVTGHTGFKGTWLVIMLRELGFEVSGLALAAEENSLYSRSDLRSLLKVEKLVDIRKKDETLDAISEINPEFIFHLAAQPLVRESYRAPEETFQTNVIGTLNVLLGADKLADLKGLIAVTTDKVYENLEFSRPFSESDKLGGHDPYSASKAMADILAQTWHKSFRKYPISIARAGNVIGGGDISFERLVPDIIRSFQNGKPLQLRNPEAVRPWQHVLDCLDGYIRLFTEMLGRNELKVYNFGPEPQDFRTVLEVAQIFKQVGWPTASIQISKSDLHEATNLTLASEKAMRELHWGPKLHFETAVEWTILWEQLASKPDSNPLEITKRQVKEYFLY